jgi:hypothetical protein
MLGALAIALLLAPNALAATPFHTRNHSLDIAGLNHACGVAVDSKGDLYASSAGTSEVKVYDPSHNFLTSIPDSHEPCGLAVTTTGVLYVSEQAEGKVVRFKPTAYPFSGTPTYEPREVIDSSGNAKGIAVDPFDNRLYVAEGTKVAIYKADGSFEANVGEGTLSEATGVAAFTYTVFPSGIEKTERYLWVADARGLAADSLYLFGGTEPSALKLRRTLEGANTPNGSFGFGTAGAYLAADPGNRTLRFANKGEILGGECKVVGEQACTAGHLFLYDAGHEALDEFDASGEYLDQTKNAGFADAEPIAIAIDRSGEANDGTIYVTAGSGAGAKALAFKPLTSPSRKVLKEPSEEVGGLSHTQVKAESIATDSYGDVYSGSATLIHVYNSSGTELKTATSQPLIKDTEKPKDIAVDSSCNVYVLDAGANEFASEEKVTYYAPSACPPVAGTTYTRHASVALPTQWPEPESIMKAIAVNPGPGPSKDRLFVTTGPITHVYKSAAEGSGLLDEEFAPAGLTGNRQSIAVNGARGIVYIGVNPHLIYAVDEATEEVLGRIENSGDANGKIGSNPYVAVDQASGHVITFDGATKGAREYDAAGAFVAEFGNFTEGLSKEYRVAVDNSCVLHELTEATVPTCHAYDPANGTVYVAFDDSNLSHPPYDVNAFGPLDYGTAPPTPKYKLTLEKKGTGSGTVTSSPAGIECGATCSAEFDEDTPVTLTASADPGFEFAGFTGCDSEPSPTECKVAMSEAREVTAEFEPVIGAEEFPLEVKPEGPGSGTVTSSPAGIECPSTCEHEFAKGTNVLLTVAPAKGSVAAGWTGCDAEPSPTQCEVTIAAATEVKLDLEFETPLLTVSTEGTGTGEVTSSPAGIECPSSCEAEFELNAAVTLTAQADPGSKLAGFTGCDTEPSPTECEVSMTEPRSVSASFEALPQAVAKQPVPIAYHEATLQGEVDPAGLQTKYHFEYLSEAEYEAGGESFKGAKSTPVGELAPSSGLVAVKAQLSGLQEGTEYRFRLLADNSAGSAEDEGTFETLQRRTPESCPNAEYRFGLSANLPDCRAYELVTPAQTDGLVPGAEADGGTPSGSFSNWFTVQRGPGAGEDLAYFTDGTLPGFEGNGILDGYRAERGSGAHPAGGWQSGLFSPGYAQSAPGIHNFAKQLGVAADQLYSAWESEPEPETFPQTLPEGTYLSTPAGFEALGRGSLGTDLGALSRYVSASGAHAIFASKAHLEPAAPPAGNAALYDRSAGSASAHVLSVPPAGASEEEEAEFAAALRSYVQVSYQGASEDGATAVFSAGVGLYVRLGDERTERISPRTARVGDTLSCAAGPLLGIASGDERHFQWLRNGAPIPGASGNDIHTNTDYTTKAADEGTALQCLTVATSLDPRSVAVSSPVWISPLQPAQAPRPPAQIAAPTPADPAVGTIETCNPGSWTGAESLAYQWYRNGTAIAAASAQTYEVQAADVPGTLQCIVTGKDVAASVAKASGLTPTSPAPAEAAPVATAQAFPKTTYAGTSEDGRYVFFALGNGESPGRLFRFDTQSEIAAEIAASGIFALVSPDGSHAFFNSEEALTEPEEENENHEHAEAGKHNLYAWDVSATRFVGQLPADDFKVKGFAGIPGMNLAAWTTAIGHSPWSGRALAPTRSSADGGAFVFQSHARLTAYDNEGVGEIYRYDPSAEEGERLICVSCDPSGAPPSADALLEDLRGLADVEGIPDKQTTMIANLTDNGQEVFFQSFDRLLPEDANEAEDVYEWKAKGAGGCTSQGGCLALISSGQGEVPSFLYGMSGDGHDVFFQTKEKLVGMDVPGSPSIYDARVGGGIPEPTPPAPCQGDACQGVGTLPPVLSNPASTGGGEGGEAPEAQACAKGKHRVKGRCVAAKHHKAKKRHGRANANRRAGR